jgi:hypothetical protein
MINNQIIENIKKQINKGEKKAPFLFLAKNNDLLNSEIKTLATELLKEYNIPNSYLYTFEDN